DRKITASVIYPTGGDKIIKIAMDILSGNPYLKENTLKTAIVDKENARVISMQNEQLGENQLKLRRMNEMLDLSLAQYSSQRMLFYATGIVLLLVGIILAIAVVSYRSKSKANRLLENQNNEIRMQAEILKHQKEEVVRLSEQLHEATNAKLVFFTNISHEFKTPLSLIIGPVETLLLGNELDEKQRSMLLLVKRNSERLLHLISEIIEFRRFENGKMEMHYSEADLKSFLDELSPLFDEYMHSKHIKFKTHADPDMSYQMVFDKEKMEKIYCNLLANAFKHVNTGGSIAVGLSKTKDYIQFSVFNTGSHIPLEEQKNIFDRFYRLENENNSTGIGLALVSSLVEMHGGSIEVESRMNEGTRFSIKFPLVQLPVSPEKATGYKGGEYIRMKIGDEIQKDDSEFLAERDEQDEKPLILVIEDNADMRHYMHHVLSDEYQISEAGNGTDGIEKAIKQIPDLVISDVMMPEKDGFEVCRTLKENISTSHIPVILLTACALDEQKAAGFESGAEAYIPKPFNAELLKIRIRKLIENRRKIQEIFGTTSIVSTTKKATLADMEQDFIDHFKAHVEKNITNPELNVDDIAKSLGLSRVQLYRKLRSLTDYTPNELIRIIRLKHAIRLLSTRSKSIAEVAYESGFSSPSYFTKCFKEQYNVNPTDYLK
ncbi:MAG: AraC family transcriptional regulator, partial [Bacteroidales bacterium 45-6]